MKTWTETEAGRRALAALATARPKQFQAVSLCLEGKKQEAIADELGITQGAVSSRLSAAERTLKRLVKRIKRQLTSDDS